MAIYQVSIEEWKDCPFDYKQCVQREKCKNKIKRIHLLFYSLPAVVTFVCLNLKLPINQVVLTERQKPKDKRFRDTDGAEKTAVRGKFTSPADALVPR